MIIYFCENDFFFLENFIISMILVRYEILFLVILIFGVLIYKDEISRGDSDYMRLE